MREGGRIEGEGKGRGRDVKGCQENDDMSESMCLKGLTKER